LRFCALKNSQKEKKIYAPMTDIGDIIFDSDGVYIRIKDHQVNFSDPKQAVVDEEAEKERRRKLKGKQTEFGEEEDDDSHEPSNQIMASQGVGESMVRDLQSLKVLDFVRFSLTFALIIDVCVVFQSTINEKLSESTVQFFKNSRPITARDVEQSNRSGKAAAESASDSEEEDEQSTNVARLRQLRRELADDNDEDVDDEEPEAEDDEPSDRRIENVRQGDRTRRRVVFHADEQAQNQDGSDDGSDDDQDDQDDQDDDIEMDHSASLYDIDESQLDEDELLDLQLRRKQTGVVMPASRSSVSAKKELRGKPIVGSFQAQFPHLAATMDGSDVSESEQDDEQDEEEDEEFDEEDEDMDDVDEDGEDTQMDLSWKDNMIGKAARAAKSHVNLTEVFFNF
jgi:hypothetical protein